MLKFQNDYTTLFATFEDFILLVYTVIDDLYQQFAPACVSQRRNADSARMSDSEIITLSICGELLGMDSENAWYSFVKRNYRHLFPNLCCRTRFNRTRRALLQVTELLRQKLTQSFPIPVSRYFVIDSFPLAVCKFGRAHYCRSFREDMREKGICLMSLKPSNHKNNWPKEIRQLIFRIRRRVETVFSQLSEQLNAEKVRAKSFQGLCTRLENKILGHNLCMAFNSIFGESCDIGKIKHLIF